ncbi:hypothetical protein [Ferrimonas kyonanensis]|uniref:hypothetical protein n=1 Tax=Ferrimonas kyonanensis TaxID=364763 RepID=UPI0004829E03|nr:hypothetical protein [Ferrimonas kyonanensis]
MVNSVYSLEFDDDSGAVGFAKSEDVRRFRHAFLGTDTVSSEFDDLELTCEHDRMPHNSSDFKDFFVGGLLVVEGGKKKLEGVLGGLGQWIPMRLGNESVFYFHPTKALDIVDKDNSDLLYYDGYLTGVNKFAFRELDDDLPLIFKMSGFENYGLVVSCEFKKYVEESALTGLSFKKL